MGHSGVLRRTTSGTSKPTGKLGKAFVVLVLLLSSGALIAPLRLEAPLAVKDGLGTQMQEDLVLQIIWFVIYSVTFFLILLQWRKFTYLATRDKLLLLLIGLAVISILWSVEPGITLRRSVALVGTTAFGVYLAMRFSLAEQLRLVAWALGIAAVLSLLFTLALPGYGISGGEFGGAWRGLYLTKNSLGAYMALGALVLLLLTIDDRRWRWLTGAGFVLCVGLLLLSGSITALAILLGLFALLPLYRALQWRHMLAVPFLAVAGLLLGSAVIVLANNLDPALHAVGKDLTLSDRSNVWAAVFVMISERPWLGYGYSSFWQGWEGESAQVWLLTQWEPPSAHNGYLDLWLNVGLLGVFVFALGCLLGFLRATAWARLTGTVGGLWPVAFLMFLLLYNLSESALLIQNNLFWVLYVATIISVFVWNSSTSGVGHPKKPSLYHARSAYMTR